MDKVAMRFGEVVLRTSQYEALKSWYSQLLDTKPIFESERREDLGPGAMRQMCILRPYSEFPFTESLVIFDFAELRQNDQTVSGMDHFQMQFASIRHLFDRYEALAAHGIVRPVQQITVRLPVFTTATLTGTGSNSRLKIMLAKRRLWHSCKAKPSAETLLELILIQPSTSDVIARAYHLKN